MLVKLKDVAYLVNDRRERRSDDVNHFVSTENLLSDRRGVSFPASTSPKSKYVHTYTKGDILISNIRPYFKKIWKATFDGTRSADVLCFRSSAKELSQDYLYVLLESESFFNYVTKTAKGTKMPRGDKSAILEFEFNLPSLKIQKEISHQIISIEKKIRLNEQINDNLFELTKNYWELFKSNSKTKYISISELANKVVTGKTPSKKKKEYYENGNVPFIKIPDMHGRVFVTHSTECLSTIGANSQKSKFIPKGSIVVSCIGTPGLVAITSKTCQTNQQINSIIIDSKIVYAVFLELQNLRNYIINLGSGGTTISNLNKSDFQNIKLRVPSIEKLCVFNIEVQPIFQQILTNELENRNLNMIKDALLMKLF